MMARGEVIIACFGLLGILHGSAAIHISTKKLGNIINDNNNNNNNGLVYDEDRDLTARQLIKKYGYRGETHHVTTDDGYILEMHRITGPKSNPKPAGKPVVFLMHGLLSSSVDWIISGPGKGLGYLLADEGYDVWMGNARGNHYSRRHKRLSVLDKDYWLFSWHEIGTKDVPMMIDYALDKSKSKKLFYAAHSQGTTAFFVMTSTMPNYNDKIIAMFALAPVAYVRHMTSPMFKILSGFDDLISSAMGLLGHYEFQPTEAFMKQIKAVVCDPDAWTQPMCENFILLIAGLGTDQMNKTHLPTILGHVPAGSSTRQFLHYSQLIKSNTFRQFDHGFFGNLKKYGRTTPPDYDLNKVRAPVILHYCVNDWLSNIKDVERLSNLLPNVYAKLKVPHQTFSHLDYIWGIDAKALLYDKTMSLMQRFNN